LRPTYLCTAPVYAGLLTLASLVFACGGTEPPPATSGDESPAFPAYGDDASSLECMKEGQTKTCSCASGSGTGTRTCKKNKFSACDCSGGSTKDASRPASRQPQCKAGYYIGNFMGKYRPGAFGFGVAPSGFEVDIAGGKSFFDDTLPPLAFTLSSESETIGEFSTFTVGGGCMQGLATAVFVTQSPFVAKLTGNLDCATGKFDGRLEGYYTLIGIPGADFSFTGPLSSQFELADDSLKDGVWSVKEPPLDSGEAAGGGEGTWDAKWTADEAPDTGKPNPCDDVGPGGVHGPGLGLVDAGGGGTALKPDAAVSTLDAGTNP
jgi:hypothetical protein